ncbi:hypothetical protein GCM10010222_35520 [Streptomyces tanashiensis]|uniref:hypothetical protein n=1 Tax=Streptomyces tanashiensis TaxID=67367 RepID=UPI0016734B8E|nr:hypothetical protein [Streptomyces tanashiensis]GGS90788.1 hypothetical protein GCM10010222_35520 [Streptomyces tanashiensis]
MPGPTRPPGPGGRRAGDAGATRGRGRRRRRGTLTDEQLPALVDMVLQPDGSPVVTYLGYAVRRA